MAAPSEAAKWMFEKAAVWLDTQQMGFFDVIEHEGEKLIVLLWDGNIKLGLRRPALVLPLASAPHQDMGPGSHPFRYGVNPSFQLPMSIPDGRSSRSERRQYGVCKGPAVTFPLEPIRH